MMLWAVALAVAAWVVLCTAGTIVLCRGWRVLGKLEQTLSASELHMQQLSRDMRKLTRRADRILQRVDKSTRSVHDWTETFNRIHHTIQLWHERIRKWSTKVTNQVHAAQQANEQSIKEALQWFDLFYSIGTEIRSRRTTSAEKRDGRM
ncbi:hypothetical protein [Paenibacillus sp. 481]|uniref:hypothetical protein n=1 Tax=Paenibacillus sp. 481 TaxID=2835869 RepID=UPI001E41AA28|nr:hypothetical protein [Paenibacillus sp. 481]UHA72555.1 hypothetical protein KIK04_18110 [Paenibacillus sp. 481]